MTGLDALTQVLEPYTSQLANPLTDALCREGIRRAGQSLRRAYEDGDDHDARREMALVSLLGGLALANAKLPDENGIHEIFRAHPGKAGIEIEDHHVRVEAGSRLEDVPPSLGLLRHLQRAHAGSHDPAAAELRAVAEDEGGDGGGHAVEGQAGEAAALHGELHEADGAVLHRAVGAPRLELVAREALLVHEGRRQPGRHRRRIPGSRRQQAALLRRCVPHWRCDRWALGRLQHEGVFGGSHDGFLVCWRCVFR